ncbi:transposase (plasmid) [Streptomyces sp. NBC_01590]
MEDQIGALGLVLNALVLFNTRYMDAAVQQLREEGFDVRDEDVARLSPFVRHHINMLGRYSFQLPRPARGPASVA